jgi:hypothetical protein
MALVIGLTLIVALAIVMIVMVGLERGPSPADVAVSYERAWDELDFESLWVLSGRELRDGLDRRAFVTAKRAAYADAAGLDRLASEVVVEDEAATADDATVITRLELKSGTTVHDELRLRKRNGRWDVVSYTLKRRAAETEAGS